MPCLRLLILVPTLIVTVTAAAAGFVMASQPDPREEFLARREAAEWPPFTMLYELEQGQAVMVGNRQVDSRQVRRLEYGSPTQWKVTVMESAPIETRVGTFSAVGAYTRLDGRKYTEFDAVTNSVTEEEVAPSTRRVPSGLFVPFRMLGLDIAGLKPTRVATTATVCFLDDCQEDAGGLLYTRENGQELVFAEDPRGIPLRIGTGFTVHELQVHDGQHEVEP
jgi:hypothetical protein